MSINACLIELLNPSTVLAQHNSECHIVVLLYVRSFVSGVINFLTTRQIYLKPKQIISQHVEVIGKKRNFMALLLTQV